MSATHRTKKQKLDSPDQYYTPPGLARVCVRALVQDQWVRHPEHTTVLEPQVGKFSWIRALSKHRFDSNRIWVNDENLDVVPSDCRVISATNFDALKIPDPRIKWDLIVGNPPFNDAGPHIEAALSYLSPMGILAFLLPIGWFTAQGKDRSRQIWLAGDAKPSHKYLITPRPSFQESGTDSATYAFVIWAPGSGLQSTTSTLDWFDEREIDRAEKKAKIDKSLSFDARTLIAP